MYFSERLSAVFFFNFNFAGSRGERDGYYRKIIIFRHCFRLHLRLCRSTLYSINREKRHSNTFWNENKLSIFPISRKIAKGTHCNEEQLGKLKTFTINSCAVAYIFHQTFKREKKSFVTRRTLQLNAKLPLKFND